MKKILYIFIVIMCVCACTKNNIPKNNFVRVDGVNLVDSN